MKILYFYSLLVLTLFLGCDNLQSKSEALSLEKDFKLVKVNDEYMIYMPNVMKEAKNLNEEASLQYQNYAKEMYIIILDEPKDGIIETFDQLGEYDHKLSVVKNYAKIQLNKISENLKTEAKPVSISMNSNGYKIEKCEFDATMEGVNSKISYFMTFIEGRENVYMIMAWTTFKDKEKNRPYYEKATDSFRFLKKKAQEEAEK